MAVIHVNARQYWAKSNGTTNMSVSVWVDGQHIGTHPLTYGRGRSTAVELAMNILETVGYPLDIMDPHWDMSWEDAGHILAVDVVWVGKRGDAYGSNIWRVWRDGAWVHAESGFVAV